jgi:hypothetical protein
LNKNIHNNTELSDSDDSDYVHVTFDLTENAANFLKKVDLPIPGPPNTIKY